MDGRWTTGLYSSERNHWIGSSGAARREVRRGKRGRREDERHGCERDRIGITNAIQKASERTGEDKRTRKTDRAAGRCHGHPLTEHERQHPALCRAERDTDADLARPL